MDTALREGSDDGIPLVLSAPDSPAAKVLRTIADQLAGKPRGLAGMALSLTPTSRNA
jgi:ATP-binding protein involved in chromosome partitioning